MNKVAHNLVLLAKDLTGGTFDAPPKMVDEIYDWVVGSQIKTRYLRLKWKNENDSEGLKKIEGKTDKRSNAMRDFILGDYDENIASEKRLKSELSGYPDAIFLSRRFERKSFKIDLSGWKYESVLQRHPRWKEMRKRVLPVFLKASEGGDRASFFVFQWKVELEVFDSVFDRQDEFNIKLRRSMNRKLRKTIEHELEHFSQELFEFVFGYESEGGGKPPEKMRDKHIKQVQKSERRTHNIDDYTEEKRHVLDDSEFYPRIKSSILEFTEMLEDWPKLDANEAFDYFTGSSNSKPGKGGRQSDFFKILKKHNRVKWRKAIKEVYKEVM